MSFCMRYLRFRDLNSSNLTSISSEKGISPKGARYQSQLGNGHSGAYPHILLEKSRKIEG